MSEEATNPEREKGKKITVEETGHKGGQKVRKLIQEGKEHEKEN